MWSVQAAQEEKEQEMFGPIVRFVKWWMAEQDKLCPHCGYYCTGKTVFCHPPPIDETGRTIWDLPVSNEQTVRTVIATPEGFVADEVFADGNKLRITYRLKK
jgi:hypothetical protein